jgi:N-acetylglutamate synthase-like GNAT family acetyltransferase
MTSSWKRVAASYRLDRATSIAVAEQDGKPIGVAELRVVDDQADLLKLFVEPTALRSGMGKALLAWATGAR